MHPQRPDNPQDDPPSSLMLREAWEGPEVAARVIEANADACASLAARFRKTPPRFAVTCARGSSDCAATYAKYLFEIRLGLVTASLGPSVSSIYGARPRMKDALFLAISQSGRSPDLVSLAETARADGAITVALVNDTASPLAERCEIVLPLHSGPERSVAATKTCLASFIAILQLVAHWSGDEAIDGALLRLPADLADARERNWESAIPLLVGAHSVFVVARGNGFAAAQESALKLKEVCGLHAEAISAAELRHGPMSLVGRDFPVIMFGQQDEALTSLSDLARDLAARKVPVLAAGLPAAEGLLGLPSANDLHPLSEPIVHLQSFYPFAARLAVARGRDPDHPPHLTKVTETH